MYAGRIVESGFLKISSALPAIPILSACSAACPVSMRKWDASSNRSKSAADLINMPKTCAFLPRCPYAIDQCRAELWPDLRLVGNQQYIRCYVNTEEKKK